MNIRAILALLSGLVLAAPGAHALDSRPSEMALGDAYSITRLEKKVPYYYGMNEAGAVAGFSNRLLPATWSNGVLREANYPSGSILDFNSQGSLLISNPLGTREPLIVDKSGVARILPLTSTYNCLSYAPKCFMANKLSPQGEVFGTLTQQSGVSTYLGMAIYRYPEPLPLSAQFGSNVLLSTIYDMNTSRQVVGMATFSGVLEGVKFTLTSDLQVKNIVRLGAGRYPHKITESGAILMDNNDWPAARRFWVRTPAGSTVEVTRSGTIWTDLNSSLTLVGQSYDWSSISTTGAQIMRLGESARAFNSDLNPRGPKVVWLVRITDSGQILAYSRPATDPKCQSIADGCSLLLTPNPDAITALQ